MGRPFLTASVTTATNDTSCSAKFTTAFEIRPSSGTRTSRISRIFKLLTLTRSLKFDLGILDDALPTDQIIAQDLREFIGTVADGLGSERLQPGLEVGVRENLDELRVKLFHDRPGRARRSHDGVPGRDEI